MDSYQRDLFNRINNFSFDGDSKPQLSFEKRLARENGWSINYTKRVIEEYKRFIFLSQVADFPVTPSDQVDQVWHLHLTYTRSYWDDLCKEILNRPLHHGPTKGGCEESAKYHEFYHQTKQSYKAYFGDDPPVDIWPDASIRFGDDIYFERVNTKRNWIIKKPKFVGSFKSPIMFIFLPLISLVLFYLCLNSYNFDLFEFAKLAEMNIVYESFLPVMFFVGIFVLILFLGYFNDRRCPECKQRKVLDKTGKVAQGLNASAIEEEWQCSNCGHKIWKKQPKDGGCSTGCGGSGCSGCSGCGGD